jgi:hypothetical protein
MDDAGGVRDKRAFLPNIGAYHHCIKYRLQGGKVEDGKRI